MRRSKARDRNEAMPESTRRQGAEGERIAEQYLITQGLRPITRNYRCRVGELDLVMRQGNVLVFVEVRLRRHRGFGGAVASVDPRKQRRLVLAAQHYLQHAGWNGPCRFDVIGLDGHAQAEWIKNAFDAE